ncbi:MAG: cytochrome c oxidase subunit 3 family protein [Deltaproteobacteria bacterium]|nr:cytochrome c oxidase subunit 3 family protein [Deltaproteobacteria bacterium]MBK8693258.1 cytochrome c oxidase subunit 3 family protein [Deltaproteobacteria bacterium]MBP7549865.1 cytochrome c oxidase subunit 3 family protein [Gemmatimonadaceae bacterium]
MSSATTTDAPHAAPAGEHGHGHQYPFLAHHFDTPVHQFDSAKLGMWIFIATEILMFGGLFVAYGIFRGQEPEMFRMAHERLDRIMGAVNTVVLLFSSLTAALAVRQSQVGDRKGTTRWLVITLICAVIFLVVKFFEYQHKFHDGLLPGHYFQAHLQQFAHNGHVLPQRAHMFFALYFMMTGLHGVHVLIGMGVLSWVLKQNLDGKISKQFFTPVEIGALYWHLVDLVWIYLFPLLYLVG